MPYIRNSLRTVRFWGVVSFICVSLGSFVASFLPSWAAAEEIPWTTPYLEDEDVMAFLALGLGGKDVAFAAWSNMNPSEKQTLRDQAALVASMAQAAERDGFLASPDVELAVRWGTRSLLAEVWEKKVTDEIDCSETALYAFYEANRQRYFDSGAVRYRQITYPPEREKMASSIKERLRGTSLARLRGSIAVGWIFYDKLIPTLAEELRHAPLHKIMGPIQVPTGHMLYEVLDRRDPRPIPFEECKSLVESDKIRLTIREKLENRLENRLP
ncbi:MAG: peptidyl-prolyl cis-trans isomerase [Synergistaceae bacterium]|nr:peptidyl-prolyl cis-trans isomerase [Synergistaceae bacterium]